MIAVTASELAFITGTAGSSPNKTMYDFTSSINRACTGSIKIDMAPEPVKGSGLVPLTIADQEFAVAPEISDAVCKAAAHGIYGYTYADSEYRSAVNSWMLRRHNWTNERIGKELGMDPDEVLRLKQMQGLAEAFSNREFSRAWDVDA